MPKIAQTHCNTFFSLNQVDKVLFSFVENIHFNLNGPKMVFIETDLNRNSSYIYKSLNHANISGHICSKLVYTIVLIFIHARSFTYVSFKFTRVHDYPKFSNIFIVQIKRYFSWFYNT